MERLQKVVGRSPADPDFPWENIHALLWGNLDFDAAEVEVLRREFYPVSEPPEEESDAGERPMSP